MGFWDKRYSNKAFFHRIERHKTGYALAAFALYLFLNNGISAWSVWLEHQREGAPSIALWEPYCWEYSSALGLLMLLPWLWRWFDYLPAMVGQAARQRSIGYWVFTHLTAHWLTTVVFSMGHVVSMVIFREGVYIINGADYSFGDWLPEFWYEYRKDAWTYIDVLIVFYAAKYIYARAWGEATAIRTESDGDSKKESQDAYLSSSKSLPSSEPLPSSTSPELVGASLSKSAPEHFLIKKLDKEYLLKTSDIEWIESAGNYVNFHCSGRIYPFRSSLLAITEELQSLGFCRIHRSHSINCVFIDNLSFQPSGDGEVLLKCGTSLKLSRRYKSGLKASLA